MAHAPGRGADLAPGSRHREDNRLGDLIEDHAPAPDIAKAAQPERAELHFQQIADFVESVLSFVDPCPRVGDRVGQEPSHALRCRRRRMHLDRKDQTVRIQQPAKQAVPIGCVQLARERRAVQPRLVARRVGLATALVDR